MRATYIVIGWRNGKKSTYRVSSNTSIAAQDYVEKKYNVQVKEIERVPVVARPK